MATFRCITADDETERAISSIDDIRIPILPRIPSFYILDTETQSIQIRYGDPDRTNHKVKRISASGVRSENFASVKAATDRFLEHCRVALA